MAHGIRWIRTLIISAAVMSTCELGLHAQGGEALEGLRSERYPVGVRPTSLSSLNPAAPRSQGTLVAVANSGRNSLSIVGVGLTTDRSKLILSEPRTIPDVPTPLEISCEDSLDSRVITSPSTSTIREFLVLSLSMGRVATVGPQPGSVDCSSSRNEAYVSNAGDNSLSIVNLNNYLEIGRIPNIPAARSIRGVSVVNDRQVWIAGSDANIVTIIDIVNRSVVLRIPIARPSTIKNSNEGILVGSVGENAIYVFDRVTLALLRIIRNVPNPQAILAGPVFTTESYWVAGGNQNVISRVAQDGNVLTTGQIPGAADLSTGILFLDTPSRQRFLIVASTDSNSLQLIMRPPTVPSQFQTSNAASFASGQSSGGSLASLFAVTGVAQSFLATALPLPLSLGGTTLRIGGILQESPSGWNYSVVGSLLAPLLFVGPNQVNFQIPPGVSLGDAVPVQLTRADGTTLLSTVRITASAPGIFSVLQNGQGQGAVLNENSTQNFGTNPARRGSVVQIFATGAGETTPALLAGEPAPASGNPLVLTNVQPTVTIGGQTARVQFSGMAPGYVGLWQINAEVPVDVAPGSAVPLVVSAGGVASNTVTIAVE